MRAAVKLFLSFLFLFMMPAPLQAQSNQPEKEEIFAAAGAGDLARVAAILKAHPAAVNARDKSGATALHYAARMNRLSVAALLMAQEADINIRDKEGYTPLQLAEKSGGRETARLLRRINPAQAASRTSPEETRPSLSFGAWRYGENLVCFRPDGIIGYGPQGAAPVGTWKCTGQNCTLVWQTPPFYPYTQKLNLSPDGNQLAGTDEQGNPIGGFKVADKCE